jgi:hypothetical protein
MVKNRRGWLRILEAFIAIILIAGFLSVIYNLNINKSESSKEVYNFQETILEEIGQDSDLRREVLENNISRIRDFVSNKIPEGFELEVKICDIDEICNLEIYRENTYSSERVISANLDKYGPKKVKIFMWED